jgi:hypothetical protein
MEYVERISNKKAGRKSWIEDDEGNVYNKKTWEYHIEAGLDLIFLDFR